MSTNVTYNPVGVMQRDLLRVMYDKELIALLARHIVANQVEANIDMMCTCANEYQTYADVDKTIQSAKSDVKEYAEELIAEFSNALREAIVQTNIFVDKVTFSADGFENADVSVK